LQSLAGIEATLKSKKVISPVGVRILNGVKCRRFRFSTLGRATNSKDKQK